MKWLKEFIENTRDTIKDNRWGKRFKLLNILTNDRLRRDIAFARLEIVKCREEVNSQLQREKETGNKIPGTKYLEICLRHAQENLDDVWHI